ncbi:MAG: AraC family transcriptional regulator [Clostridiales bacterium]|nr:AraC family transcriptional regulator [Clostridiales bacterium]
MTLEQFIQSERKKQGSDEAQKHKEFASRYISQQIEKHGFYSVPIEAYTHGKGSIAVVLHGVPSPSNISFCPAFHNHDYFELMYVHRGHCVNCFQDRRISLSEGDLLLLNPNILHDPYTTHEEDVMINIMLSRDLFQHSLMPLLVDNELFTSFFSSYFFQVNCSQDYLLFPASSMPRARQVVVDIIEEYLNRPACYKHVIESELVVLFALLARSYSEQHDIRPEMGDKAMLIANILSYVNQHCADISLKKLEDQFSYSSGHISRIIQKHTGKTFSELVQHYRLEKVRSALESSQLPITELVQMSGFNDLSYLNKVFKKKFGLTPAQYRRSLCQSSPD